MKGLFASASLAAVACAEAANDSMSLGAYFVNWAQYRDAPYKHTPENIAPIMPVTDHLYYGFAYFCPPAGTDPVPYWSKYPFGNCGDYNEYQLMTLEPKDPQFMDAISQYKGKNPQLKLISSIGGWNFPSAYWSKMISSKESRAKFIASVKTFMTTHKLDGIDIDWEFPCSPPRDDVVVITPTKLQTVHDAGGKCPDDTNNLLELVKDLREGLGKDAYISIASQAGRHNYEVMNLKAVSEYIDHYNIMSYDYTVSDVPGAGGAMTSPNQPLFNPDPPALQMSLSDTVEGYLALGVPASKIQAGLAYYGHTWYKPGLDEKTWKSFGWNATIQGKCWGPFAQTYGGKPDKGGKQCGLMMYSEILAAGCQTYHDEKTVSDIAYCAEAGKDGGFTEAGTWIAYQGPLSLNKTVAWAKSKGLAGVFIFDTSEDTVGSDGVMTFELTRGIAAQCGKTPLPPAPAPGPGPAPPSKIPSCCWSKWGDSTQCGDWTGPGGKCNTNAKSCNGDNDCAPHELIV